MANNTPRVVFTSHTAEVTARAINAAQGGLWKAGRLILSVATNLAPLDTGTLRRSGVVSTQLPIMEQIYNAVKGGALGLSIYNDPPRKKSTTKKGKVGYSMQGLVKLYVSFNTPYAARLHENMKWTPRAWKYLDTGKRPRPKVPKPAVGQAKYLETAVQQIGPKIANLIARELKSGGF